MRRTEFMLLVEKALRKIPSEFRKALDNVEIVVEDWPDPDLVEEMTGERDEVLYGLYQGVPLPERGAWYGNSTPDVIVLYRKALETDFASREELAREIEVTLVHEIAHYFGFDETQLEEYGYD